MDAYMYQYSCPGDWYGNYNGLRNVYTSKELSDEDAINLAKDDLKTVPGAANFILINVGGNEKAAQIAKELLSKNIVIKGGF